MNNRFFTMIIVALVISSAMCVQAQNYDDDLKSEISLGYGLPVNTSNSIESFAKGFTGTSNHEEGDKYIGPITAEYFYHINPLVAVGAIGVYSNHKMDETYDGKVTGKIKYQYFTIMPAVKFNWLRREKWGLYSKIGLGYTYAKSSLTDIADNVSDETDGYSMINWQASLIGTEVGNQSIRAFAELGFGEQGLALAGVRFRF